jgi:hypothetical protein
VLEQGERVKTIGKTFHLIVVLDVAFPVVSDAAAFRDTDRK